MHAMCVCMARVAACMLCVCVAMVAVCMLCVHAWCSLQCACVARVAVCVCVCVAPVAACVPCVRACMAQFSSVRAWRCLQAWYYCAWRRACVCVCVCVCLYVAGVRACCACVALLAGLVLLRVAVRVCVSVCSRWGTNERFPSPIVAVSSYCRLSSDLPASYQPPSFLGANCARTIIIISTMLCYISPHT